MTTPGRRAPFLLFLGDIAAFAVSLALTLLIRYRGLPSSQILGRYVLPFIFLFLLWALVFYMAGLYGKRLALFPSRVPDALLRTQFVNIVLAALFFFFIPVGIAPKTVLALYLLVSLLVIYIWRLAMYPRLISGRAPVRAALIAEGEEAAELAREVNGNPRYGVSFVVVRSAKDFSLAQLAAERVALVVADTSNPGAPGSLAQAVASGGGYQFAEFADFYEETFDRIPLSRLTDAWFWKYAQPTSLFYAVSKRAIDIAGGLAMLLVTIILAPFVYIADLFEGPGSVFLTQVRIGEGLAPIRAYKFRSMTKNLAASGEWTTEGENRVTQVGNFLRLSSLDEFPQALNVLRGEISLIGPRSDIEGLGKRLAEAIPYYNARYSVKPGITGWAQINQQYEQNNISPQSIAETKTRLAYDFYYLKHRSLGLDIVIALKTVKRMFFRVSSW